MDLKIVENDLTWESLLYVTNEELEKELPTHNWGVPLICDKELQYETPYKFGITKDYLKNPISKECLEHFAVEPNPYETCKRKYPRINFDHKVWEKCVSEHLNIKFLEYSDTDKEMYHFSDPMAKMIDRPHYWRFTRMLSLIRFTKGEFDKIKLFYTNTTIKRIGINDKYYVYDIIFHKPDIRDIDKSTYDIWNKPFDEAMAPLIKFFNKVRDILYLYEEQFYTKSALLEKYPKFIDKSLEGISKQCDYINSVRIITDNIIQKYEVDEMSKYIWGKPKEITDPQEIKDLTRLYEFKRGGTLFNKYKDV